jgi:ABC-type sugar transport system ATPase subunit
MTAGSPFAIALDGITKSFGGVAALRDGRLAVRPGTIHALVGENGAGKSTLAKIIAGVFRPDDGTLLVSGEERRYSSPRQSIADGITIMSQELSLLPARSVLDNVFLGSEQSTAGFLHGRQMRREYHRLCARVGLNVDPDIKVRDLRLADQQRVEMLRAFARNVQVIILDEPTATLSTQDAALLLQTLRRFRDSGVTIIYISHFLEEVLETADEVTVLRDGAFVLTGESTAHSPASLVTAMAGRPLDLTFPAKSPPSVEAAEVLSVQGLSTHNGSVRDVSFVVRAGEIVCLGGLVGSGRSEVAHSIYGALRHSGEIRVKGKLVRWTHPRSAISHRVTLIPESRKAQGILPNGTLRENLSIAYLPMLSTLGWVSRRKETGSAKTEIAQLDIRPVDQRKRAINLSGGNQQKVLFGRALMPSPELLIIDEPTRGVDVGAKRAIYELIVERARAGLAILVISSETDEVLGLAHRIVVMRDGRTVDELDGLTATKEQFVAAAFTPPTRRELQ